jgi:hypothetical protein
LGWAIGLLLQQTGSILVQKLNNFPQFKKQPANFKICHSCSAFGCCIGYRFPNASEMRGM